MYSKVSFLIIIACNFPKCLCFILNVLYSMCKEDACAIQHNFKLIIMQNIRLNMDTKRHHIMKPSILETSGVNNTMHILIFENTNLKTPNFHIPFPFCPS